MCPHALCTGDPSNQGCWCQQRKIRKAQWVLSGGTTRRCQICFVIEGSAAQRKVWGETLKRIKDIEEGVTGLTAQGFILMWTEGYLDTLGLMAKVATDMSWKTKHGNIEATLTYTEFLSQVRKHREEIGDGLIEWTYWNQSPPVVTNAERAPKAAVAGRTADAAGKDDDFDPRWSDKGAPHDGLSTPGTKSEETPTSSGGGGGREQRNLFALSFTGTLMNPCSSSSALGQSGTLQNYFCRKKQYRAAMKSPREAKASLIEDKVVASRTTCTRLSQRRWNHHNSRPAGYAKL